MEKNTGATLIISLLTYKDFDTVFTNKNDDYRERLVYNRCHFIRPKKAAHLM